VATEKSVPLLDLHARSIALCEKLGPEKTAELNPKKEDGTPDTTHLEEPGSTLFAELVIEELARSVPALAPYLRRAPTP
jgi:pectinesterase